MVSFFSHNVKTQRKMQITQICRHCDTEDKIYLSIKLSLTDEDFIYCHCMLISVRVADPRYQCLSRDILWYVSARVAGECMTGWRVASRVARRACDVPLCRNAALSPGHCCMPQSLPSSSPPRTSIKRRRHDPTCCSQHRVTQTGLCVSPSMKISCSL